VQNDVLWLGEEIHIPVSREIEQNYMEAGQTVADARRRKSGHVNASRTSIAGIVILVLAAAVAYIVASHSARLRDNLVRRDSIAYWAAGKLLVSGHDPYDVGQVLALERSQGYSESKPLVLRTPPWSLFLVIPLGRLNAFAAWTLWVALSLGAVIVSIRLCWKIYGNAARPPAIFLVVAYLFAPIPACLVAGQMGLVLLLGIVLFLWWEPSHPFIAGMALILPLAKPHVLSLVWVVLVFWAVKEKQRRLLAGLILAFVMATGLALIFQPAIFQHYQAMLRQASIGHEFIPAFSGVIRLLLFRRLFWVQFIPMALGLAWACWFYRKNRARWNWREHGPALLIVSVLTTPYAWLTDEVVLLPAILQAAIWVYSRRHQLAVRSKLAVSMFAALNFLLLLILNAKVPFATGIYFWSSLLWSAWYFCGRRVRSLQTTNSPSPVS
jgi:hypothetical protein